MNRVPPPGTVRPCVIDTRSLKWTLGVLTPFYAGVLPSELRESMESVVQQTLRPSEWVVVVDGPVPEKLNSVLGEFEERCRALDPPIALRVIRLTENVGNGRARAAGMSALTSEFVAIQDADDISRPERFLRTVRFMEREDLDFAGAYLAEFVGDPAGPVVLRNYPTDSDELGTAVRWNNPIGHPSFIFRREAALKSGGYLHLPGNEDYDLIARMIARGYRGASLDEPLVLFRTSPGMFQRRGARGMVRAELEVSKRLRSYGLVGPVARWPILAVRIAYRLAPAPLKRQAHRMVLSRAS